MMGYAARRTGGEPWSGVREAPPRPYGSDGARSLDTDVLDDDGSAPGPPALDADAIEELGEEICLLAAHIHAATRRLLGKVAVFDAGGGWKPGGHRGCENWFSLHTGYALRTAREYVRIARSLEELPGTGASMGRGALSIDQVRALTWVAMPENEADLLVLAEGASTAVLERECRAWKTHSRSDEAERERELHRSRRLALYPNGDGMVRLDALLVPGSPTGTTSSTGPTAARRASATPCSCAAAGACWPRERDVPDEVLFRALEASAPG